MKNFLFLLIVPFNLYAQNEIVFDTFRGVAIFVPVNEVEKGYGKHLYSNKLLNKVQYNQLNIPKQNVDTLFPGVNQRSQFGLLLKSTLSVYQSSCFEISIDSDDGSKLWLNKELIIDNDMIHQMKMVTDTIWLNRGLYKAKLWYYNGFPDEYGLVLSQRKLDTISQCDRTFSDLAKPDSIIEKTNHIQLSDTFLFPSASYTLSIEQKSELDKIIQRLQNKYITELIVQGNTDDVGKDDYNHQLSKDRAQSVYNYLSKHINLENAIISIIGHGETNSYDSIMNTDSRTRKRNVHIFIKS